MEQIETAVIGAGQAGLATSYHLSRHSREHVVLEKDRIGESWRSGKWDSFALVTPNWMLNLPGQEYDGDNPDGFLKRDEVVLYLKNYTERFDVPVRTGIEVNTLRADEADGGFQLQTNEGPLKAANVVVATGTFQKPRVPSIANNLSSKLHQFHSSEYRNPEELPPGAVLVVGSAQSGCQIAEELNQHGRQVYLCTGKADRLPRRYRGKDSFWWADKLGLFDETVEDLPSPDARFKPNPQVTSKDGNRTLSLHHLAKDGVHLLGHFEGADGMRITLADDLEDHLAQADEFAAMFKKGVDTVIEKTGMDLPEDEGPVLRDGYKAGRITELDLEKAGVTSVIWATGYRFDYSWIRLPVFDHVGYPVQDRGATKQPGLYFVGLHWLHTRASGLLSGVGNDAAYVAKHIVGRD